MVTAEEIKKLAFLAKLRLTETEIEKMAKEMSAIVAFADAINTVPIERSEDKPLAMLPENAAADGIRPDVIEESFPREAIFRNAGGGSDGYFLIKKRK